MSRPSPYNITTNADGSIRVELDAHYLSDEQMEMIHASITKLQDENERLRELVRDMWRFTGAACKKYPRLFDPAAQGGQVVQLNMIDAFEQRMRELGVEVDA